MRIEIILDEADLLGIWKVLLGLVFQRMSVVCGGTLVGDFDMSPAFERSEEHEKIGGSVSFIFVIVTCRSSRLHRDACTGVLQ